MAGHRRPPPRERARHPHGGSADSRNRRWDIRWDVIRVGPSGRLVIDGMDNTAYHREALNTIFRHL